MRHYLRDPAFSHFDTIPECDRHTTMAYIGLLYRATAAVLLGRWPRPPAAAMRDKVGSEFEA